MLINITGTDGSGKSTQVEYLSAYLRDKGHSVFVSKAYGPREKDLFEPFLEGADQLAIMFFFQALHVQQRIVAEKEIAQGSVVIADRWDESYRAYHEQFGILSRDAQLRERLNEIAFNSLQPNMTILLQVPVQECARRRNIRGTTHLDRKTHEHLQTIAKKFQLLAQEEGWKVVDGNRDERVVHQEITNLVDTLLAEERK